MLDIFDFKNYENFILSSRKDTLVGFSKLDNIVVKISVGQSTGKLNSIRQEFDIITKLNNKNCQSSPYPIAYYADLNTDNWEHLCNSVDNDEIEKYLSDNKPDSFDCFYIERIIGDDSYSLADVVFSMIEQKSIGYYHADIKPKNILFDKKMGICRFFDYDQAFFIPDNLTNGKFFDFCDRYDVMFYKQTGWLRHFSHLGWSNDELKKLFEYDSFNMANASVFKLQKTTNSQTGIYHTIENKDIFIDGSRALDGRLQALDKLKFDKNEKVLDVGCNAGLLCHYLENRECDVTGIDNDHNIIVAAKMISNIMKRVICFDHFDLDNILNTEITEEEYQLPTDNGLADTVMLFSVLHHTKNPVFHAKGIAENCSRIVLETRLVENGKQPHNGQWVPTSSWNFSSIEDLITTMEEQFFVGFKHTGFTESCDKGRYILEFRKS